MGYFPNLYSNNKSNDVEVSLLALWQPCDFNGKTLIYNILFIYMTLFEDDNTRLLAYVASSSYINKEQPTHRIVEWSRDNSMFMVFSYHSSIMVFGNSGSTLMAKPLSSVLFTCVPKWSIVHHVVHRWSLTHWGRDKWTPFRRRHFQMHFLEWKCLISD